MGDQLFTAAAQRALVALSSSSGGDGYQGIDFEHEFFPEPFLFVGTPFEFNRLVLVRLVAAIGISLIFVIAARRAKLVPSRGQSMIELVLEFVRKGIAEEILGAKARKYTPVLTVIFIGVFAMNITGIIPGLNIAASSVVAVPLVFALFAYVAFIAAGIKERGGLTFFREQLFMPGIPWPIYFILAPIELLSTFVIRPVTLTMRLLANMMVGHLILVLAFTGTHYLFFEAAGAVKAAGTLTFGIGIVFLLFETFVAALQAYIFTLLTSVYINLSVEHH